MKRNLNTTTPFVIALAVAILCGMGTVLGQKAKPSGKADLPGRSQSLMSPGR